MATIIPVEATLLERARWLVRLRWIAAAGGASAVFVATTFFHLPLDPRPLVLTILWMVAYNTLFSLLHARKGLLDVAQDRLYRALYLSFNAQIALDWISLAVLLHFSGGLENPFLFFFFFHAILASILLPRKPSYVHATLAALLVCILGVGEHLGWLHHVALGSGFGAGIFQKPVYLAGVLFAFTTTMYLTVYLTSEISAALRRRERDLARLGETLRAANERLLEHDRVRSEYVLRVSHDLQSPLAAITSMLNLVLTTMSGTLPDKGREFLERSLRRVDGLLRLARGLFDLSRIRASRTLAIEPFSLRSVVEAAIEDTLNQLNDKKINLSISLPSGLPFVSGDKDHIEIAFIQLLTNAAQYSLPGVTIAVRARGVRGNIEVAIEDTGVGIPADEIPLIFDEFYRGSMARELEPNGWGLGLTLVKHIVDRHGGTIRVASEPGRGSVFTITLPGLDVAGGPES